MDLQILRKKISTFKGEGGRLTKVSDDLAFAILTAWEQWTGSSKEFYSSLDVSQRKMARIIGRAKRLKREGVFPESDFKEIQLEQGAEVVKLPSCGGVEVVWKTGQVLRFSEVDMLIDFLKKVA